MHDARNSLRTGDIVEISPGWRVSKDVRHVVNKIIAPFGEPVESRPGIMSRREREEARINKKLGRDTRRYEKYSQLPAEGRIMEGLPRMEKMMGAGAEGGNGDGWRRSGKWERGPPGGGSEGE